MDQATAAYTFQVPDGRTVNGTAASNTLTIPVRLPNVALVKSASFPDVAVGDTLQYTSVVTNNGIVAITNVVLSDPIPAGSTLVPGSVVVAGTARPAADPASGISVGTIAPGGQRNGNLPGECHLCAGKRPARQPVIGVVQLGGHSMPLRSPIPP
ncbi:DUF11 domain-containing protein [Paenibacillus rhizoplanae]